MSKVAIVGVEGSGKTVLMAALGEMYGKASHDSLYLMPENQAAFSFMTRIPHKMRVEHQWPEATAIESMKYLKWTVRYGTEVLTELEMLDYPGELYRMAFGDRKESEIEPHKEQIHEFLEHLVTADFLIVLLNLKDAMDIGANSRNNETVWLTRGIFDYAKKLPNIKNRLLVFTQSDRYRHLLEGEGGAKALQEKHLPMLSILHPDLECATISAVDAPESEGPSVQPTTDGGLQELMAQIVMASETGRHALDLFDKCQNAATEATGVFSSISELDQAIQQYAHALDAVGKTDAGVICAIYPGALDAHSERQKLLEEFLSELRKVRSTTGVNSLAGEHAWSGLLVKYEDIPNFMVTIHNLIRFYAERNQADKTARRIFVAVVAFVIGVGLYFAWQEWADRRITKLKQKTGLEQIVCEKAFAGDASAQFQVGNRFRTATQGRDLAQAVEWLYKSAAIGHSESQNELSYLYYNAPNYLEEMPHDSSTYEWFRKQAERDQPWAQNILGEIYFAGLGVPKDEQAAMRWWMKSAENGNLYGMVNVGNAKCRGDGGQLDYEEALKWYRKAADLGFAEAQLTLGMIFMEGNGIAKDEAEAAKWFRMAAEKGDGVAQRSLGVLYSEGRGVSKDYSTAAKWYQKSADQGDAYAQYTLGLMYLYGRGVQKSEVEAAKWIRMAAEQELPDAQYSLALLYAEGRGVSRSEAIASSWFRKAAAAIQESAESGNADAQNSLGSLYRNGHGVEKDETKAIEWYRKSAGQGYAGGQYNLGLCLLAGDKTKGDLAEAYSWLQKAAEQGLVDAMVSLGDMHAEGRGADKDLSKAYEWYRKAADTGDAIAQNTLGNIYYSGQGIVKDETKAIEWYRKSAAQGDEWGQHNLAVCLSTGKRTPAELSEAISWFKKAAEQKNVEAQISLGNMYYNGLGVAKDGTKALEWFRKAADQGNVVAQNSVGVIYAEGLGGVAENAKAVEWFRKAADQGHPMAQFNLGTMYAEGRGVAQNYVESIKWYEKAGAQGNQDAKEALEKIKNRQSRKEQVDKNNQARTSIDEASTSPGTQPIKPASTTGARRESYTVVPEPRASSSWENRQRQVEAETLSRISGQKIDWTQYSHSQLFDMRMAAEEIQKLNRLTQSNYDWRKFTHSQAFDMRMASEEIQKLNRLTQSNYDWRQFTHSQAFDMRMAAEEIQKLNRLTHKNYDWRKYTHSQAFDMRMAAENNIRLNRHE